MTIYDIPVNTANFFWVFSKRIGGPAINIYCNVNKENSASLQVVTGTAEKTNELVKLLLKCSKAKMVFPCGVDVRENYIKLSMYTESKEPFNEYVLPNIFQNSEFRRIEHGNLFQLYIKKDQVTNLKRFAFSVDSHELDVASKRTYILDKSGPRRFFPEFHQKLEIDASSEEVTEWIENP